MTSPVGLYRPHLVGLPACAGLFRCDLRSLDADIFVSDDADLSSRLSLEIGDSMVNTDISQLTPAQLEAARASLEEAVDKLNLKIKEESAQESLL